MRALKHGHWLVHWTWHLGTGNEAFPLVPKNKGYKVLLPLPVEAAREKVIINTTYQLDIQSSTKTTTLHGLPRRNLDIHPLLCWRAPWAHVYCEVWIQPTNVEHLEGSFFALSTQWLVIRMALHFCFQRYVIQRIFKQNKPLKCLVPKHYKKTKTNMIEKILTK